MRKFYTIFAIAVLSFGQMAEAHKVTSISLVTHLDTEENTYLLDAAMEVVPSEDAEINAEIPPEEAAREFAEDYLNVLFDEEDQTPGLTIELIDASDEQTPEGLQRQAVVAKMEGSIPEGAKQFLLYLEPNCPMAVVMVVIKDKKPSRRMQVVLAGEYSRPVDLAPIVDGDPFVKEAETSDADKEPVSEEVEGNSAFVAGWSSVFRGSWLPLAVVVATFLLTLSGRAVFIQFAALLIPLSTTIALRAWEIVPAPQWAPQGLALLLIAISVEAVFHRDLRWWRVIGVAAAGAFAGLVLSQEIAFGQLFRNAAVVDPVEVILCLLGIEAAFILVALLATSTLLFLSRYPWYRGMVVLPLAALCVGYGLFCQVERFL